MAAVRRERNIAVAHWFGVQTQWVTSWQKALGVPTTPPRHRVARGPTVGSLDRWACWMRHTQQTGGDDNQQRNVAGEAWPERVGTDRPATGTPAEDELVRTLPPAEVAAKTGRTLGAVYSRRCVLK